MSSLSQNLVWNVTRVMSNLLYPLITFPYTARILGPEVKGEYEYITAIVAYFTLFANLGFPLYGIREVAKCRDSKSDLSNSTSAIFTANLISAVMVTFSYIIFTLSFVENNIVLYLILGSGILLSCIQFDWFYQGIEEFRYITLRSILFKILSLGALFAFVRSKDDIIFYALISTIALSGNNLFNYIRLHKYVDLRLNFSDAWKHTKGASTLFLGTIAVSLYTYLNTVMLGALDTKESVGYFTAGNKMVQIAITIINTILSTIIPRISYKLQNGEQNEGRQLQIKVLRYTLYLCIPSSFIMCMLSKDIIYIMAGPLYSSAVIVSQILSALIIIVPLSQFIGLQVLYPVRKEKYGNYAVMLGATTNVILNATLIGSFSYIGVAIAVVSSELVVTIAHVVFSRKYFKIDIQEIISYKMLVSTIIMILTLCGINKICEGIGFVQFFLKGLFSIIIYVSTLSILKDKVVSEIINKN